jgi:methenyltetrahydromethanopterin cyclohydrolase
MGRTNDAILFGGSVELNVKGTDAAAEKLAQDLPSCASKDYGRLFGDIFKAVNMDFYKIDPLLFSPAKVTINNVETGNRFNGGALNEALIEQSFGS